MSRANRQSTTRSAGKSPSVTNLYKQFERADAVYKAIPDAEEKRWNRAVDRAAGIANRIIAARAKTVDEMLLKIRVTGWLLGVGHKKLEDLDRWQPKSIHGGETQVAFTSLREDLQRLKMSSRGDWACKIAV